MKIRIFIHLLMVVLLASCTNDLLDEKPDQSLLIPSSLSDFNALLDNLNVFNQTPGIQHIASDDFYTTDNGWKALSTVQERTSYYWADDIYETNTSVADWDIPYKQVFYSNIVLDGLDELNPSVNSPEYNRIKGTALFSRAFACYNIAQLFAAPYEEETAASLPGIPIRLSSDVNIKSIRGTVKETYDQIIADLKQAVELLPLQVQVKSRPCKAAASALLARVYLAMSNYSEALQYASEALNLQNTLIDYRSLNASATRPMPVILPNGNDEVIYYAYLLTYGYNSSALTFADSTLFNQYKNNDLRKSLFFTVKALNMATFRGSYTGNSRLFSGLATDELFLICAECKARLGNLAEALSTLDFLLQKRYVSDPYTPSEAVSQEQVLKIILEERRKELIGRGLRWTDLRRLNRVEATAATLKRTLNGTDYTLSPGSDKYLFTLPPAEINLNGLEQNPR